MPKLAKSTELERDVTTVTSIPNWHDNIGECERVVVCPGDYNINDIAINGRFDFSRIMITCKVRRYA